MSETTTSMPVAELIGDEIITVPLHATVAEAAAMLRDADIGAAAVGSPGDIAGIISERDIVHLIGTGGDPETVTVEEIASDELVRCDQQSSVAAVALEMLTRYVRHVVVMDDGRPIGIVSARDLLGVYAEDDVVAAGS